MKTLRSATERELGPFKSAEVVDGGYLVEGCILPVSVVGEREIVDVPDDYVPQWRLDEEAAAKRDAHNADMKAKRAAAYRNESDPLFFQAQRGEATQQQWLDKVAEIEARFPYLTA